MAMYSDRWQNLAACQGLSDVMFPTNEDVDSPMTRRQIAEAKTVCGRCPVTVSCLEEALRSDQSYGVWGGLDRHERAALKRARVAMARDEEDEELAERVR